MPSGGAVLQRLYIVGEFAFEPFVAVHGQDELARGSKNAPRALNEGTAQRLEFAKAP